MIHEPIPLMPYVMSILKKIKTYLYLESYAMFDFQSGKKTLSFLQCKKGCFQEKIKTWKLLLLSFILAHQMNIDMFI